MRINLSFKTRAENKNMETLDFWSAGAAVPGWITNSEIH